MRIPSVFASQLGIGDNTPVELSVVSGALLIRASSELNLEQLLTGTTEDNLHSEVDTGPAVGAEIW